MDWVYAIEHCSINSCCAIFRELQILCLPLRKCIHSPFLISSFNLTVNLSNPTYTDIECCCVLVLLTHS